MSAGQDLGGELLPYLALHAAEQGRRTAKPQRADDLRQREAGGDVAGNGENLVGGEPVEGGVEDPREATSRGSLGRRIDEEMHPTVVVDLGRDEERRLTLGDRLEALRMLPEAIGQRRQGLGELEQHLETVTRRSAGEVLDDLAELRRQSVGGHAESVASRSIGMRTEFPHSVHEPS